MQRYLSGKLHHSQDIMKKRDCGGSWLRGYQAMSLGRGTTCDVGTIARNGSPADRPVFMCSEVSDEVKVGVAREKTRVMAEPRLKRLAPARLHRLCLYCPFANAVLSSVLLLVVPGMHWSCSHASMYFITSFRSLHLLDGQFIL
jgi:hypothetical protein